MGKIFFKESIKNVLIIITKLRLAYLLKPLIKTWQSHVLSRKKKLIHKENDYTPHTKIHYVLITYMNI